MLTIIFKALDSGDTDFTFSDTKILANDGKGTDIAGTLKTSPSMSMSLKIVPMVESAPSSSSVVEISKFSTAKEKLKISQTTAVNGKISLLVTTEKKNSSVDKIIIYEKQTDNTTNIVLNSTINNSNILPLLSPGVHNFVAKVIDKSGNVTEKEFSVNGPAVKAPVLISHPEEIKSGTIATVTGDAHYPTIPIRISLAQDNGKPVVTTVKSDNNGKFTFSNEKTSAKSNIFITASTLLPDGSFFGDASSEVLIQIK